MIRVFIVDDHAIVRAGLIQIMATCDDIEVCGQAGDGRTALAALAQFECDVLLLDISMPGMGGMDVLRHVRHMWPEVAVLVLTMHNEDLYGVRVMSSGAAGFLTKDVSVDELTKAVRHVAVGRKYISASLAEKLVDSLGYKQRLSRHETLSAREFQVMIMLASGHRIKEIALSMGLSPKTISTYQSRIFSKMNMTSRSDLLKYALQKELVC